MEIEKSKSLADWILKPDGKALSRVLIIAVIALSTCVIFQEVRYIRSVADKNKCEQEKQQIIDTKNELFLNFVIKANQSGEMYRNKFDSLSFELIKLKK